MKSIVVPENKQAEIGLDYDKADDSVLITWNIADSEFEKLDRMGVFKKINYLCDVLIDEYEDAHIASDRLHPVLTSYSESSEPLIRKLMGYMNEAIKRNTSIHFYF